MKIRQGFISNSSSSSYLLCFPTKIESKKDLDRYVKVKTHLNKSYWGEETLLDYVDFLWNTCKDCTDAPDLSTYIEKYNKNHGYNINPKEFRTFLSITLGQDAMKEGDTLCNNLATRLLEEEIYKVMSTDVLICEENHH